MLPVGFLSISIHYLAFDIFDSDKDMIGYYCCASSRTSAVFKPQDKKKDDSSILPMLVSTTGLRSCLVLLHKLLILRLSLDCVQRKKCTKKLLGLWISSELLSSNPPLISRKSSIHAATEKQSIAEAPFHSMLLAHQPLS